MKLGSRIAIFAGAGASKAFSFPLTAEFLPKILQQLERGVLFGRGARAAAKHDRLQSYLRGLFPGLDSVAVLPLITDVLSLVDHALQTGTAPIHGCGPAELRRLRALLEEAIFAVLEWPYGDEDVPMPLQQFAAWLERTSTRSGTQVGFISTNYDIAVDEMLFWRRRYSARRVSEEIDFGFAWRDYENEVLRLRPAAPRLRVFKLHGSVNWLRCDACEHIYVNTSGVTAFQGFRETVDANNTCDCNHHVLRAVLVAPSLVRDVRDVNLLEVWKSALEFLRIVDQWVIIGYSFPPEDVAIRSLFLRAYHGRARPPRVVVVCRAEADEEKRRAFESRYQLFFPKCEFFTDGMEGFASDALD